MLRNGLLAFYVVICLGSIMWPGYKWFGNRIEPYVLGLPFSLAWVIGWVGLSFVDFENGSLLQLTGRATIDWDSIDVARHPGAQRLVIIDIDEIVRVDGGLPLRWSAPK